MQQFNIYDVKTHLSKLVEQAHQGETIIIAKAGKPWAKIIPFDAPKKCFKFGTMKGKIKVSDDFNDPLPDEIIDLFEKGDDDLL
ncbi:MAG: type II toxin-antitoxin system Phd/YefM family antitoxin [Gammaproteobacteria bacterium]|nr:type II toxin-antitoxin system Phd/YefM family antitoxin [Gammaproteobacteria bacterium]